jgi:hypothetical protein
MQLTKSGKSKMETKQAVVQGKRKEFDGEGYCSKHK